MKTKQNQVKQNQVIVVQDLLHMENISFWFTGLISERSDNFLDIKDPWIDLNQTLLQNFHIRGGVLFYLSQT